MSAILLIRVSILLIVFVGGTTACEQREKQVPRAVVLMTVNGEVVTRSEFDDVVKRLQSDLSEWPIVEKKALEAYKKRAIRELLERTLLEQQAKARGITISAADIEAAKQALHGDVDAKHRTRILRSSYTSDEQWHTAVARQLMVDRAAHELFATEVSLSEEALRRHYEDSFALGRREREILLQQIVVSKKKEADEIYRSLLKRPDTFGAIAKESSVAPEAEREGIVGWVRKETLPPAFDAVFRQSKGVIGRPRKTDYGYHIWRVLDIRSGRQNNFEQMRKEVEVSLRRSMWDVAYQEGIEELVAAANVELNQSEIAAALQ